MKGSRGQCYSYRPIGLTSVCCKVFESILKYHIMEHLACNKLINDSQHGFRSGRSFVTNLLTFFEDLTKIIDIIAKILEKLVLSQVSSYLNSHNLYNTCQSAYRPGHSTETALLKVVSDLFLSLNKGNISVLALLDFSSAFDTIDHTILVHRLHTDFGFTDTVLQWFSSYLTDRTHYVSM